MFVVFDTETTGLPVCRSFGEFPDPSDYEKYATARVVEIAWIVLDNALQEISRETHLLKPAGFNPDIGGGAAIHGIPRSEIEAGEDPSAIFTRFLEDAQGKTLVGHNVAFDMHVVASELSRLGMDAAAFLKIPMLCTMKEAMPILGLKRSNGEPRMPRLAEMYEFFHGRPIQNAHRALGDCESTLSCFRIIMSSKLTGPLTSFNESLEDEGEHDRAARTLSSIAIEMLTIVQNRVKGQTNEVDNNTLVKWSAQIAVALSTM